MRSAGILLAGRSGSPFMGFWYHSSGGRFWTGGSPKKRSTIGAILVMRRLIQTGLKRFANWCAGGWHAIEPFECQCAKPANGRGMPHVRAGHLLHSISESEHRFLKAALSLSMHQIRRCTLLIVRARIRLHSHPNCFPRIFLFQRAILLKTVSWTQQLNCHRQIST